MTDKKTSDETDGSPADGADQIRIARSGSNFRLTLADVIALAGGGGSSSDLAFFGNGSDGDLNSGFGTVTLARDGYYGDIALGPGDKIICNGWTLHCLSLDTDAADAGAISWDGTAGGDSTSQTGGVPASQATAHALGTGSAGVAGTNGTSGGGNTGVAGAQLTNTMNGGVGGNGGAGGVASAGGGGASKAAATAGANPFPVGRIADNLQRILDSSQPIAISGGQSGASGAGGAGDSGVGAPGGGGGASGNGGNVVDVRAKVLIRGAYTPAGVIRAIGGKGGLGGPGPAFSAAGGGGGGGGGGGWAYVVVGALVGTAVAGLISAAGGNGGDGGLGSGTGGSGNGGYGGHGGRVTFFNTGAGTSSETIGSAGSAGGIGSGASIGVGGAGGVCDVTV